ncbi:MAG: hypothetical protein JXB62_09090 [Pirellulales bacterium]|nr:hypothetical protein [Pirellulales bacterium]
MPTHRWPSTMAVTCCCLMTICCRCGPVTAQSPDPAANEAVPKKATSYVSIVKQQTGDPALVIQYPWKVHQRPSIEVRLVTSDGAGGREVRPLFFVKEFFRGAMTINVYACLDRGAGVPMSRSVTEQGIDFQIFGRRNALGRPAVSVACEVPADDPAPGAAVVFCLLPDWAIDGDLLHLELPPEHFTSPGKLYVWFLRGGEVLWQETCDWPGERGKSRSTSNRR